MIKYVDPTNMTDYLFKCVWLFNFDAYLSKTYQINTHCDNGIEKVGNIMTN